MYSSNTLRSVFAIAVTVLTIFIIILFFQYNNALNKAYKSSKDIKRINVEDFAKNIESSLKDNFSNCLQSPFNIHPSVRYKGDQLLSTFTGNQYAFVFLIAKDAQGRYRYIFDGAKTQQDKGQYLQKFDPASDAWDKVLEENRPRWITQDSIHGLWVTYLHPISMDGDVKAILAFDFSAKEYEMIKAMFLPISKYLLIISGLLSLFLLLVYVFGYLFYRQRKKTFIDPLTGLYNRHYLNSIANGLNLDEISIALIDIDHFKRINDTYGHKMGDEVLHKFSLFLAEMIRPKDILIRYGGEEFLLFLKDSKSKRGQSEEMIRSIHDRLLEKNIKIRDDKLSITASIGFNATPYLNRSLNDAIDVADTMLYAAKTSGRNRVEVYKDKKLDQNVVFGPREVTQALEEGRVVAYFQPIADARNGRIVKQEMLVRIFTKAGVMIPPNKFLPNIKSNSSYRDMSKFMVEKAIKTIQEYKVSVSLNFDVGDFLDKTIYEQIHDTLTKNKELTSMLTIELLEDRQVDDFENVGMQISKLQALGVSIAVDDFGTGYSTFSYLLALNPDILKIDGFLISRLTQDPQAEIIVSSIVKLCKQLDIKIVAEFVENEAIKHKATAMGIDFLQGYAIGKPSPDIQM